MSAFSQEPVAMVTATEARAMWQALNLTTQYRKVAGEENNPVYQGLTAMYRAILAARDIADRGNQPRQTAETDEREYWNTTQVARSAGVSERTVRNHCADQTLPALRPHKNGPWMIPTEEALTYINRKKKR